MKSKRWAPVADALEALAAAVRGLDDVAGPDWIDQGASVLGRRRHRLAVRRRIAHAEGGAAIVGRRHLLSLDAMQEELTNTGRGKVPRGAATELREELTRAGLKR